MVYEETSQTSWSFLLHEELKASIKKDTNKIFGVIAFKIYWVIRDSPKSYIINWSVRKIYINFKTQPEPVAKNAIPRPPAWNRTRDPGSLDQRSTDWTTEAVAMTLGTSSPWRRANARNVRLHYPYWQYTDLFIFRFVSVLCQRRTLRLVLYIYMW